MQKHSSYHVVMTDQPSENQDIEVLEPQAVETTAPLGGSLTITEDDDWGEVTPKDSSDTTFVNKTLDKPVPSYWDIPDKPERPQNDIKKEEEIISLEQASKDLLDGRYELFGHGTISSDFAISILRQGLLAGGEGRATDMDSNFLPLGGNDLENLEDSLNHWGHKDAKFIVLFRVPVKYKLPFRYATKEMYSVFYHNGQDNIEIEANNESEDDGLDEEEKSEDWYSSHDKGVYESNYIYGYYDANTGLVHKNTRYNGSLDNPTDNAYMQSVYDSIKSDYISTIPEGERQSWENRAKFYYDYQPETSTSI